MFGTAVIAAIISGSTTLLVCLINNYYQARVSKEQNDKQLALLDYRLGEMEKKQGKHNNLVERTAVNERDIKTVFKRFGELNDKIKELEHR